MGLRFECQPNCTRCCEQDGFVYVTNQDIERIAGFLQLRVPEFVSKYVYKTSRWSRFRVKAKQRCPFLVSDGCSIHVVKPVQCRMFPFWPEYVDDRGEWYKLGDMCPGIGKGPLVQIAAARAAADEMRREYPSLYE